MKKISSNLTRKQLALRLFALLLLVNGALLLSFVPTSDGKKTTGLPSHTLAVKVKASLYSIFHEGGQFILTQGKSLAIGPVILLRQEEDGLIVGISETLYRQHHLRLTEENWAALPYLAGMLNHPVRSSGVSYEIAY